MTQAEADVIVLVIGCGCFAAAEAQALIGILDRHAIGVVLENGMPIRQKNDLTFEIKNMALDMPEVLAFVSRDHEYPWYRRFDAKRPPKNLVPARMK